MRTPAGNATCFGSYRATRSPTPSSPSALRPQQNNSPDVVSAQVVKSRAVICVTDDNAVIRVGVVDERPPVPNCPKPLSPQHHTSPVSFSAQVWSRPAITCDTLLRSITGRADRDESKSPVPNCPNVLSPQHFTVRSAVTAQLCCCPAATAPMVEVSDVASLARTGEVVTNVVATMASNAPATSVRIFIVLLPSPAGVRPPSDVQSHEDRKTGHFLVGYSPHRGEGSVTRRLTTTTPE